MKHLYKKLLLVGFVLLSLGCGSNKALSLLYSGKVNSYNFYESLDFEYRAGLPVIQAEINGKTGYFLFDTGASMILDKEFANEMMLKTKARINVNDSGGNSVTFQPMVKLKNINIGAVHFENIGAIVLDLKSSAIFKCVDFDGIIGSNLMRHALWKIDYQNQKIVFTDALENFEINKNYNTIPFRSNVQGTPLVDLTLDGIRIENVTFDTGSNGKIDVLYRYLQPLRETKKNTGLDETFSTGSGTYGVGGNSIADTTFYAKVEQTKIGDITLENKILEFRKESDIIGNEFLSNYDVILDWVNKNIYLKQVKDYQYTSINEFGFDLVMRDQGVYICCLYDDKEANENLRIGDKILEINGLDFNNMSLMCEKFVNKDWDYKAKQTIHLKVERDAKIIDVVLNKKKLF